MLKLIKSNKTLNTFPALILSSILLLAITACNKSENQDSTPIDTSSELSPTESELTVQLYKLVANQASDDKNNLVGDVTFSDNEEGLLISLDLKNIIPGSHGFHLHNNPSCDPAEEDGKSVLGLAAGDHFDPHATKKHAGPFAEAGHLGDLPLLTADKDGVIKTQVLAPRLKLADIKGRAVIIHAGSDNYSDSPKAGGGGARQYCGVIAADVAGIKSEESSLVDNNSLCSRPGYSEGVCAQTPTI